jgi:hypothetical protein
MNREQHTEELERALGALPLRSMSAGARARIAGGIQAAERANAQRVPWWRRPIPLWQSLAANLAVLALAALVTAAITDHRGTPQESPRDGSAAHRLSPGASGARAASVTFIRHEWGTRSAASRGGIDIRSWNVLNTTQGDQLQ